MRDALTFALYLETHRQIHTTIHTIASVHLVTQPGLKKEQIGKLLATHREKWRGSQRLCMQTGHILEWRSSKRLKYIN